MVELLAVTAIVGILAGLLLPALSRVREKSRVAVCMSNLRQVGQAAVMYQDEYGVLPTASFSGYFVWNGGEYLSFGRLVSNGQKDLAKAFFCPSARSFKMNDPDTGIQNLGVPGRMTVGDYYSRSTLDGAPTVLSGEIRAVLADLHFPGDETHERGLNVLYTDSSVRFVPVAENWSIAQAGAWSELDFASR